MIASLERLIRRFTTPEVLAFLMVGGTGYIVDVLAFNYLRTLPTLAAMDPSVAKVMAVAAAMVVTYIGNQTLTWRGAAGPGRRRQVALFVVFNVIGLGFSIVTLMISHDLLGLTSRLADNISANVIGLALGTGFRYLTYKKYVFVYDDDPVMAPV
ncbi:MAG: GtrA family protein [Aeromicrobium sp.]|nr:GtrA family protein [Aeromicrobium sp.]